MPYLAPSCHTPPKSARPCSPTFSCAWNLRDVVSPLEQLCIPVPTSPLKKVLIRSTTPHALERACNQNNGDFNDTVKKKHKWDFQRYRKKCKRDFNDSFFLIKIQIGFQRHVRFFYKTQQVGFQRDIYFNTNGISTTNKFLTRMGFQRHCEKHEWNFNNTVKSTNGIPTTRFYF